MLLGARITGDGRPSYPASPDAPPRQPWLGILSAVRTPSVVLVAALGLMAGAGCSSSAPTSVSCPSPISTTTVTLADFSFTPACTAAASGATLTIKNAGIVPHTFTVTGTSIDVPVAERQSAQVTLSGLAPGTYQVVCRFHPNMKGSLKVG